MMAPPTSVPQSLATATTPSYAYSINEWGGSGIGEGLFNDPRYIAVDGDGNVYVGDYQNGRIQRFSAEGEYQDSWSVSDAGEHIYGMAVTHDSQVFVSVGNYLKKFNGLTGEQLGSIQAYESGEFGDLTTTIDGDLIAVWYQGRWGMYFSSDEGHREDLVFFHSDLNILSTVPSFIRAITGDAQTDVKLAVDGNGMIYASSESKVYVFTNDGKFVDQFGPGEGEAGAFHRTAGIAVDGQGRVFVVDGYQVHVFSPDYSFIADIQSEESLQMISIDAENHIWGLARDKVIEFQIQ
jgi:DNA-binding beta-propeller fold protein YncE